MSSCRGISCRCPARPCTGSSSCQSTSLWRQTGIKKQVWKEARGRQKRISGAGLALWPRVTQQVDDPLVVGGKQPYGVFEEQHERRVDHPVGQLVRAGLSETKRPDISIAAWKLTAWNIQQKEKKKKKSAFIRQESKCHSGQEKHHTGRLSVSSQTQTHSDEKLQQPFYQPLKLSGTNHNQPSHF